MDTRTPDINESTNSEIQDLLKSYSDRSKEVFAVMERLKDCWIKKDIYTYDADFAKTRKSPGPPQFVTGYLVDGQPVNKLIPAYVEHRLDAMREQCLPIEVILHVVSLNQHPNIRRQDAYTQRISEFFEFGAWLFWEHDTNTEEQLEIIYHMESAMKRTGWTNPISVLRDKSDELPGYYCFFDSADAVDASVADGVWRAAYKQLPKRLLGNLNMKEMKRIANICPRD